MLIVMYLAVGLVVVGKQRPQEVAECGGLEVMVVLLLCAVVY